MSTLEGSAIEGIISSNVEKGKRPIQASPLACGSG